MRPLSLVSLLVACAGCTIRVPHPDLKVALTRAVAAVHREREKTARAETTEREKKAREDERTKVLNERRESEGPLDRGSAASGTQKVDWLNISAEEFARLDAVKTADRRARAAGLVRR